MGRRRTRTRSGAGRPPGSATRRGGPPGAPPETGSTRAGGLRGQAHTLEAVTAALLLVTGVSVALQTTAVTPLSASTSNQQIENQLGTMGDDLLAAADANGTLREAVVHWNASAGGFVNASDDGYYENGAPPNAFGGALDETFGERYVAYNVYVSYWDNSTGAYERQTMVYSGAPSDNAIVASHTVTIFNDTRLVGPSDHLTVAEAEAGSSSEFYASDALRGGELYNVLEVRLVVWRM